MLTERQALKYKMSLSIHADEKFPVPEGKSLIPFQNAGVVYATYALEDHNAVFFTDPPGLGKTIQSIVTMNAMKNKKALVLCPSTVADNWRKELELWSTMNPTIGIFTPQFPHFDKDIVIMSYYWASKKEAVAKILKNFNYEVLVLDESHNLKNVKAKRTQFVLAKNGLRSKAKYIHAMTGTPIVNRPMETYPIVRTLCPVSINSMSSFDFGVHFCAGYQDGMGHWNFKGASNMKVLGQRLRAHFMVRRKKEEVLPDLPPIFQNVVYLNKTPDAESVISKLERYDENLLVGKVPKVAFEEISTLRRELGLSMLGQATEYIQNQLDAGHEKILVFAHHKEVISTLKTIFKDQGVVTLTGDTSLSDRATAITSFQNDPNIKLFIGSIQAAGVGITLTAASYVIFVEFSWVPGENEQAHDRTHRIGQLNNVLVDYLVYKGTISERILKTVLSKKKTIREFTE